MSATLPDLTIYTDDDLQALQDALDAERTRRLMLASVPEQVTTLAQQYVAAGGDATVLTQAVNAAG